MADQAQGNMPPDAFEALHKAVKNGFDNKKYTDLVVACDYRRWNVNKLIVCQQSEMLEKACTGGFKEAHEGLIVLRETNPNVVEAMLIYMYTSDYDDGSLAADGSETGPFHIAVFKVGDAYLVPSLSKLAVQRFAGWAHMAWNTEAFAEAIEEVFTNTPKNDHGLRNTVLEVARLHANDLFTQSYGERFREVGRTDIGFTYALTEKLATNPQFAQFDFVPDFMPEPTSMYLCGHCRYHVPLPDFLIEGSNYTCSNCGFVASSHAWLARTVAG